MAAIVEVIIEGKDNASGVLGTIGGAFGNLGSIVSGVRDAFDLVAGAFQNIADFSKQFIDSASESEQAVFQLEAILRATGGAAGLTSEELQDMANELQGVTRFSDEAILSAVSMLLTFKNIGEETFPRATKAMVDMGAMFGNVDQSAVQLGKALNDPIAGIGALSRIGIQFTEEQKKMIENFVKTGDVAAAQNIILLEVEGQMSGLAEAMGNTFQGRWDIFLNKLDTLKELVGGPMIAVLGGFLDKLISFGGTDFSESTSPFIIFLERFNELLENGAPFWYALGVTFGEFREMSPIFLELASVFLTLQNALDQGAGPLEAINITLEKMAAGDGALAGIANFFLNMRDTFLNFIEAIRPGLADFQQAFYSISKDVLPIMEEHFPIIAAILKDLGENVLSFIVLMFNKIGQWFFDNKDLIVDFIEKTVVAFEAFLFIAGKVFDIVKPILLAVVDLGLKFGTFLMQIITGDWSGAAETIKNTFLAVLNSIPASLVTLAATIIASLVPGAGPLVIAITNFVNTFINTVKSLFGISSPSTMFMDIGRDLILGLIAGIGSLTAWAMNAVKGIVATILAPFKWILDLLGIDTSAIFSGSSGSVGTHPTGGTLPPPGSGTGTGGGTVVNQYFAGAVINVGSWEEIIYDCVYPNPFVAATSSQLGSGTSTFGNGTIGGV